MTKFGVAGNSASFFAEGHSTTVEAAAWCAARGIDLFEYSFGRGVNVSSGTAAAIGAAFAEAGVAISAHAPYYINFANTDPEKIELSIEYVMRSLRKVVQFGGDRVVVHPASQGKLSREEAVDRTVANLRLLAETVAASEYAHCKICLETMGKIGQIGTVDEVIEFVQISDNFYPCFDFGHINARSRGALRTAADFESIFDAATARLPLHKVQNMHIHFSKIRYADKGEIEHLTFADEVFGPDYRPMLDAIAQRGLSPYIVCESDSTQAEDTLQMKDYYLNCAKRQC